MKNKRLFFLLLMVLARPAYAIEVQEVRTDSGLTAWLAEDHSLPLIAVNIAFREAGSASDTPKTPGRAYLAGELLMEGAGERNALAFQKALEDHAIRLSTSVDEDLLKIAMETLSEEKSRAFALLGDMLTRPRFAPADVTRLRHETRSMLRQLQASPGYALQHAWRNAAFGAHPYANPPYGTPETLERLQSPVFKDYAARYLSRENMLIAVAGDISPDELKTLLETHLAALPAAFRPDHPVPEARLVSPGKTVTVARDIPQTLAAFGLEAVKRSDPRYFPVFVMNQVLGGGGSLNSRLGDEIREERGLAYYVGSQLSPSLHTGLLYGQFGTRTDQVARAVEVLKDTIGEMQKNGVKQQELDDAKAYLVGSFPLSMDSNGEVAGYLISMQLYDLGRDYLERRAGLIDAVSKEQVDAVAREFLDPRKMLVVLVGKDAKAEDVP